MSQQLTLEVPDEVYQALADEAATAGKTVAEVAGERLAKPPATKPGSGLLAMAGTFDFGEITDLSTRHHEYLGQSLADEMRGNHDR
ncbi:MAG: hypothetical protein U0871_17600 [Gemmataceae bacterium]